VELFVDKGVKGR